MDNKDNLLLKHNLDEEEDDFNKLTPKVLSINGDNEEDQFYDL